MCHTSQPCRWIFLRRQQIVKIKFPLAFGLILLVTFKLALPPLLTFSLRQGFLSMASVRPMLELQTCLRSSCCFQLFSFSNLSYNILRSHYFLCSFSFPWEPSTCLSSPSHWFGSKPSWLEGWMNGWMDESQSDLKSLWWVPLYVDSLFLLKIHF